ncbi:MAG: oligosaccharide repeat unit polymerase [Melioribacter sp.]|nr:oligosaccharide repeat unit polymerase [Melioribacter sp.]
MSLISFISFAIFFFIITYSLVKREVDIFSPSKLFVLVWSLSIGITQLKLSRLQFDWTTLSWIYLLIPIFAFLAGTFTTFVIFFGKRINTLNTIRDNIRSNGVSEKRLTLIIFLLFFIYLMSYLIIYAYVGYVPLFTKYPNEARTKWSLFGVGLFVHLAPVVLYLVVLYWFLIKKKFLKKVVLFLVFIVTLISFLFLLQRFGIFIAIVLTIVFIYYATNKFNYVTFLGVLVFIAGLSYLVLSLRAGSLILQYFHYVSQMKYSAKYSIFTEPYMYIAMNLENYAYATTKIKEFTYGLSSFDFLFAVTGLKHWLREYVNFKEYPFLINYNYNTYGMFFAYFRDFYVFGIFVIPYLLGMLVEWLYYRMYLNPNINTITIYGLFVMVILFSFFNPVLSWLFYIFDILVLFVATKFITKKESFI